MHDSGFVVANDIADQYHFGSAVTLGLGGVADGLHIAFIQMLEACQLYACRVAGAARFEIVGDLDDGRHGFPHLAEEFQTDGTGDRRHLVQYPAGSDDDAVGAFLLDARHAAEEFVGDILAQADLAAGGTGQGERFFIEQFLAARIKTAQAEFHLFLLMDLAEVVVETFDFQPVAVRIDHSPPGQVVERGTPQHGLLAAGVHGDVAADAGGRSRGRVHGKDAASQRGSLRYAVGDHAGAGADGGVGLAVAREDDFLYRPQIDQFFRIDDGRVGRQRHGAAGVAGAAATRNDGQSGFDAAAHEMADFFLGVRVENDEGVFDAPVGGVGDMRHPSQAVEGDVVAPGMLAQRLHYLAPHLLGFREAGGKTHDGVFRCNHQALHLGRAHRIFLLAFDTALLDFTQTVAQCLDQRIAALRVGQQIIFQVRVALYHPHVAEDFVQHACRSAGNAFGAQLVEHFPQFAAEQTDDDLAVRKGGVVVGDFAQAGGHGQATGICQRVDFSVLRYNTRPG